MKSERLLSALLLLQANGRLSERELAERLEVSQRTAHRDMEALCAAGIPLLAHRGVGGGWELEKGWRTKVPALEAAELQALLMVQPSTLGDRRLRASAQRAFDKLMAALTPQQRAQADSIRVRLHIDPTGWRPTSEDLSALTAVQDALTRDAKLTFRYAKPEGPERIRTVDPLGLVSKQAAWYLVARTPDGMRTFRVSRMREAVALAITFERPPNFDLARWWQSSTEALRQAKQKFAAILAMAPDAVAAMRPWTPMRPVEYPRATLPSGWKAWEVDFDSEYAAHFVALGLGSRATLLAPERLRHEIAAEIAHVAEARVHETIS